MARGNAKRAEIFICNLSLELDFLHLPKGHAVDAEHRLGGAAQQPALVRWMIAVDDDGEDDDRPLKSHCAAA